MLLQIKEELNVKRAMPTILIVFIFLAGISVFMYPAVSNYLYKKNSSKAIIEHAEKSSALSPEQLAEE